MTDLSKHPINHLPTGQPLDSEKKIPLIQSVEENIDSILAMTSEFYESWIEDIDQFLRSKMIEFFQVVSRSRFPVQWLLMLSYYLERVIKYKPKREINFMILLLRKIKEWLELEPETRYKINNLFISDTYFEELYWFVNNKKIVDNV